MAFNFPSSPSVGQSVTVGNKTWTWNGTAWSLAVSSSGSGTAMEIVGTSTDYTLVLADANKMLFHPAADTTPRTWTIPANSAVEFPVGTVFTFDNDYGAGALTIAITTDAMIMVGTTGSTGTRTLASGGQATVVKVDTTRWRINGTGLT